MENEGVWTYRAKGGKKGTKITLVPTHDTLAPYVVKQSSWASFQAPRTEPMSFPSKAEALGTIQRLTASLERKGFQRDEREAEEAPENEFDPGDATPAPAPPEPLPSAAPVESPQPPPPAATPPASPEGPIVAPLNGQIDRRYPDGSKASPVVF